MTDAPRITPFGHAMLDRSRAALVRLAIQADDLGQYSVRSEEVSDLLSRFVGEVYRYITLEENWLKEIRYPMLEQHLLEHQAIIEALAEASMGVMQGQDGAIAHLQAAVRDRFLGHILGQDGHIARYVASLPDGGSGAA